MHGLHYFKIQVLILFFKISLTLFASVLIWESLLPHPLLIPYQTIIQLILTLHMVSHIYNELQHHRYTSPFSCSCLEHLIRSFHASPLGTVPEVSSSSEQRVIQDLSYPRDDPVLPSVNNDIDSELFTCNWGTFNNVRTLIVEAPTNTEAATLNVDSAFRHCPIILSQQSMLHFHHTLLLLHFISITIT